MIGAIYPGAYYPMVVPGVVFDTLFVTVDSGGRWSAVDNGGRWIATEAQHFSASISQHWLVVFHGRGDI